VPALRPSQACFQEANHEGHDVSFYISRAVDGGCCDCGDESAWARSGFCQKHGKVHTRGDMLASLPSPLPATACVLFSAILEELLMFVRSVDAMEAEARRRAVGWASKAPLLLEALEWLTNK